jgi:hypothetical protein
MISGGLIVQLWLTELCRYISQSAISCQEIPDDINVGYKSLQSQRNSKVVKSKAMGY